MLQESKRQRIVALDLLRGYFLLVILIDHLGFFPSPFELLTGRGNLWASAAEGFFLISGLLVGYVYTPRMARSFRQASIKILQRARLLYIWSVVLTFLFTLWGHFITPAYVSGGLWKNPPIAEFVYKTLTLQYSYGWADFLQYYAVFMVFAPLGLWLCLRGLAWLLVAISIAIWILLGNGYYLSWQLLFAIGIITGYYFPRLQQWYAKQTGTRRQVFFWAILGSSAITVLISSIINRLGVFLTSTYSGFLSLPEWLQVFAADTQSWRAALTPWTVKEDLGLLRLLTALLWFAALYLLFRRYEKGIDTATKGTLRKYGENSLLVYVVQSFVVFGALAYLGQKHSIIISTLLTFIAIVITYLAVIYQRLPAEIYAKLRRRI